MVVGLDVCDLGGFEGGNLRESLATTVYTQAPSLLVTPPPIPPPPIILPNHTSHNLSNVKQHALSERHPHVQRSSCFALRWVKSRNSHESTEVSVYSHPPRNRTHPHTGQLSTNQVSSKNLTFHITLPFSIPTHSQL